MKTKEKIGKIVDDIYEAGRRDEVYGRLDRINQILELFKEQTQEIVKEILPERNIYMETPMGIIKNTAKSNPEYSKGWNDCRDKCIENSTKL